MCYICIYPWKTCGAFYHMPKRAVASRAISSGISIQNWLMFIQGIHIHWYVCHLLTSIRGLTLSTKFSMVQWLLSFWSRLRSPIGSCSQLHSRRLVSIPRLPLSHFDGGYPSKSSPWPHLSFLLWSLGCSAMVEDEIKYPQILAAKGCGEDYIHIQ